MADQFEYQRRFDYRKQRLDEFYKDLDYIYRELRNVPSTDEGERGQIEFVVSEIRRVEQKMDRFIQDLYD